MSSVPGEVTVKELLTRQLGIAWALTQYHLESLTTEECLWRPAEKGLHVWRGEDGLFRADWPEDEGYGLGPSSIGWLTWHLGFWWQMVIDHTFGAGTLQREAVRWPGSAEAVRAWIEGLHATWTRELSALDDAALRSTERARWPFPPNTQPLMDVVAWANVELTKSASEIGYARFLYAVSVGTGVDATQGSD